MPVRLRRRRDLPGGDLYPAPDRVPQHGAAGPAGAWPRLYSNAPHPLLCAGLALAGANTYLEGVKPVPALAEEPAFLLGVLFVLVGFGFKIAAVPFHYWTPDAYQGSPTPVGALLATVPKCASVAVFLQTVLNTELMRYTLYTGEPAVTWLLSSLRLTPSTV